MRHPRKALADISAELTAARKAGISVGITGKSLHQGGLYGNQLNFVFGL